MDINDTIQKVAERYEANVALAAGVDSPQNAPVPLIIALAEAHAEAKQLLENFHSEFPEIRVPAGETGHGVPEGEPLEAPTPELRYARLVESNYLVVNEALETIGNALSDYRAQ